MPNIFDIAKCILEKTGKISTWKLQKLCYYAQAWTLAWEERELFPEEFQAWSNGPVCLELYNFHTGRYLIEANDISGDSLSLSPEDKENVDITLSTYGNKDAYWLREQTHYEEPWKLARNRIPEDQPCTNIITKDSMGEYYGSL